MAPAHPERVVLDIPYVKQKPDFCGEAVLEMVATYFGRPITQQEVHELAGMKGVKRGAYGYEMFQAVRNLRLETNPESTMDWSYSNDAEYAQNVEFLLDCLAAKQPVLIGMWDTLRDKSLWKGFVCSHFVLLIGYDMNRRQFFVRDPLKRHRRTIDFDKFKNYRENDYSVLYQIQFKGFKD